MESDASTKPARLRVMHLVVAGDIGGAERLLVDLAKRPEETGADHEKGWNGCLQNLEAMFSSS